MANPDGVVQAADVRAADALLDAWAALAGGADAAPITYPALRGMFASHLAEVRTAGYLEGHAAGRREAGNLIREALRGEGL